MRALFNRIQMMAARAIATQVDDSTGLQSLQVELLADEVQDSVERFTEYGFTSVPFGDAEAVTLAPGGLRSRVIVICVADRRYRLKGLESGEVALHDDQDQVIHIKRDGIEIVSPLQVKVMAPTVIVAADAVHLGDEGGAGVARIGDAVTGGVITGGSTTVFAV